MSPLFFSIRPEGALSTGSLSGAIPDVEPDLVGDLCGTPFTSAWSVRGNPPAPEVMPEASQPLAPAWAHLARCVDLAEACTCGPSFHQTTNGRARPLPLRGRCALGVPWEF